MRLFSRAFRGVFSPRSLTRRQTLAASERLSAATHLVASLELLSRQQDRAPGGVNDWRISRENIKHRGPAARAFFDFTSRPAVSSALNVTRAASAAFLLAPTDRMPRARAVANGLITASSIGLFPGHLYGTDGSDQASLLVQAAATVARSSRDPRVVDAALWFLALQSTLNYTASGWVKMVSPTWRSGRALDGVMRTVTYGHEGAWRVAQRVPRSARTLAHAVLAMECSFPAVFAAGGRLTPLFAGSAAAFHLANARLMGLGRFVGAFGAMHPALFYVTDPRRRSGSPAPQQRRDDSLPGVAAAVGAAALATGLAVQRRRRKVVGQARPGQQSVVTRAGNTLTYQVDNAGGAGPMIFFEAGLASTDLHWEWLRRGLSDRYTTVVYQRAGYGSSTYRGARGFTLTHAVDDFQDLADHLAGDRRIVIVGHSLGGYLAMRSAATLRGRVEGIVLIDASHPGELRRSVRQAGGAAMLDSTLRLMAPSTRLGLGSLLHAPESLYRLPDDVHPAVLAQYRDSRIWSAAHREWKATRAEFMAFDGQLPKVDAVALVLTAEATVQDDPIQADLAREMGESSDASVFHVIPGSDHDTIITRRECAEQVMARIGEFVDSISEPSR